jgi:hypothetical protein
MINMMIIIQKNHEISKIMYRILHTRHYCRSLGRPRHDVLETEEETHFLLRKAEFSQGAGLEIFPGA